MSGIGTVTFDGLASGIDTASLVDQLMEVESRTKILKEAELLTVENQVTAWQEVNTYLLAIEMAATELSMLSTWNSMSVASSDATILTATSNLGAPEGTFTLEVEALATSHQIATPAGEDGGYTSVAAAFGVGELGITVGDTEHLVILDENDNSLEGVAQAINDADLGVTALIVFNGTGYQLMLAADETGLASTIAIDATNVDTSGARDLATWTTVQEAQDALVSLGSGEGRIQATSPTNTITELIQGFTLDLHSASPGTAVTLAVDRDTDDLAEKAQAFVDAYNEAASLISNQMAYDTEEDIAGILIGDTTLQRIQRSLSDTLLHVVESGSAYRTLSSVGITLGDDGLLEFDTEDFEEAVQSDFEGASRLFRSGGSSDTAGVSYVYSSANTQEGTYLLEVTEPATRAILTGTTAPTLSITEANDELTLAVDGGADVTVTLTSGVYQTPEELAAEIQAQVNAAVSGSVTVAIGADGALSIVSDRYGSASEVEIVGGDAVTNGGSGGNLGLTIGLATGTDVVGTLNGESATGNGQVLTGNAGNAGNASTDGLQVLVTLESPGEATVTFTKGIFSLFDELLGGLTEPYTGSVGIRQDSLSTSVTTIEETIADMEVSLEEKRQRLYDQFLEMELAIQELNTQGDYLIQQIESLNANWG